MIIQEHISYKIGKVIKCIKVKPGWAGLSKQQSNLNFKLDSFDENKTDLTNLTGWLKYNNLWLKKYYSLSFSLNFF